MYTLALTMKTYHIEDVFLTGFVRERLKVPIIDLGAGHSFFDAYDRSRPLAQAVAVHGMSTVMMRWYWNEMKIEEDIQKRRRRHF